MLKSMTGFATRRGEAAALAWAWEIRSVNGRGFDLRLRLPEGVDGLEAAVRAAAGRAITRGSVTVALRLNRAEAGDAPVLDPAGLDAVLHLLDAVQARALDLGITLAQPNAADVLAQRGVLRARSEEESAVPLAPLMASFEVLLEEFGAMRAREGAALQALVSGQIGRIAELADAAFAAAGARAGEQKAALAAQMTRILDNAEGLDEGRLMAELALLAVKSDVTEEVDRLRTHVAAARALLDDPAPAGRRLDFLAQEFNREANTLCSKAGNAALTAIGLELKAVIDQMREQIQNVE